MPVEQGIESLTQQSLLGELYDDEFLNECYDQMLAGLVHESMDALLENMNERQLASSVPEWRSFVDYCMIHPIRHLVHQDPITKRAYEKPRGYAGDAILLDYIYNVEEGHHPPSDLPELSRKLLEYSRQTDACKGVCARATRIGKLVDQVVSERHRPNVLSVAAGHMREAGRSTALKQNKIGRWIALDSDAKSLQETRRCYSTYGVETVAASVRRMLSGRLALGEFDLIYSTGLYDYLQQPLGRRLTRKLFEMLRPGGRLLIANFLAGIPSRGYMDSFMDWILIYRDDNQMRDLATDIEPDRIASATLSKDPHGHIVFLLLERS
jgi:hypothetical protein